MDKFLKNLPVDFYFLLIPSISIFLFSSFFLKKFSVNAFSFGAFYQALIMSHFGAAIMVLILIVILAIIFDIFGDIIFSFLPLFSKNNNLTYKKTTNWKHILSIFLIVSYASFTTYSLLISTDLLFKTANPEKTGLWGNIISSWDRTIFGTNPGIWLINNFSNTFFEKTILWVYGNIFWALTLIFLISFFFSKNAFRKLILSFSISWIIALPFWFFFPAISPDLMFRIDRLEMASPREKLAYNNFTPSIQLKNSLEHEEKVYKVNTKPSERFIPISTFPSMHAAWGTVIAYTGIVLCPWLGIALVPLSILNDFGAVYILEHYSVDIFLGIIIALISIFITEMLMRREKKYFYDKFELFSGFNFVSNVVKNLFSWTKNIKVKK